MKNAFSPDPRVFSLNSSNIVQNSKFKFCCETQGKLFTVNLCKIKRQSFILSRYNSTESTSPFKRKDCGQRREGTKRRLIPSSGNTNPANS
jgi:hypothetical protein